MRIQNIPVIMLAAGLMTSGAFAANTSSNSATPNPHVTSPLSQSTTGGTASGSASSGAARPVAEIVNVRGCNNSDKEILVALNYVKVGDNVDNWRYEGWFHVKPGECRALMDTGNRFFYLRAEEVNSGDKFWGDGSRQCVTYPGPYDFYKKTSAPDCPDGAEATDFTEVHAEQYGAFTYNFNP